MWVNCYRVHQKSLNFIYPFKFSSNFTNKNVSWLHFSWATQYYTLIHSMKCVVCWINYCGLLVTCVSMRCRARLVLRSRMMCLCVVYMRRASTWRSSSWLSANELMSRTGSMCSTGSMSRTGSVCWWVALALCPALMTMSFAAGGLATDLSTDVTSGESISPLTAHHAFCDIRCDMPNYIGYWFTTASGVTDQLGALWQIWAWGPLPLTPRAPPLDPNQLKWK